LNSISVNQKPSFHSMQETAILHWAALSYSGSRKPRNDDSLIAFASGADGAKILEATGQHSLACHDLVFAISDGMGGGNAGDIASSIILRQMATIIPETFKSAATGIYPDSISHLSEAIRNIHDQINAAANQSPETSGMAATLALSWFTPENLYLSNVGDSRIYRSRAGVLEQLSRDHTSAWSQWKRGEISEIQYRSHPRRAALYEIVGGGHSSLHPHFAAIPYEPGDRFLICSDGLIDGLWERHISDALASRNMQPRSTAENLMKRAIDNAGIDDTSLILISVSHSEENANLL
jgi:PPM family protein phosphatase